MKKTHIALATLVASAILLTGHPSQANDLYDGCVSRANDQLEACYEDVEQDIMTGALPGLMKGNPNVSVIGGGAAAWKRHAECLGEYVGARYVCSSYNSEASDSDTASDDQTQELDTSQDDSTNQDLSNPYGAIEMQYYTPINPY